MVVVPCPGVTPAAGRVPARRHTLCAPMGYVGCRCVQELAGSSVKLSVKPGDSKRSLSVAGRSGSSSRSLTAAAGAGGLSQSLRAGVILPSLPGTSGPATPAMTAAAMVGACVTSEWRKQPRAVWCGLRPPAHPLCTTQDVVWHRVSSNARAMSQGGVGIAARGWLRSPCSASLWGVSGGGVEPGVGSRGPPESPPAGVPTPRPCPRAPLMA